MKGTGFGIFTGQMPLLEQRFTVCMSLLTATITYKLQKRCNQSSPK